MKMDDGPLVSILMTVFNREKYISEAIESVLESTYTNFELIIVDDNSHDSSVKIAKDYEKKDSRIKLYINNKNLGQFRNRNKAANLAKGKYLKYLDSDDLLYPHGLQVMVWAIEQFPNAAFAISYPKPEDKNPYPIVLQPESAYKDQFLGTGVMDAGPSAIIFNRKVFIEVGGFSESSYVGNDTEILYRMARNKPIVKMPTSLVWWRRHEGQDYQVGKTSNEYLLYHHNLVMETLKDVNCPLSDIDSIEAIARQKQHHARKILATATKHKNPRLAWKVYLLSKLNFWDLLKGFKSYQ